MPLTNIQYDAIMRLYNERQLRHKREQTEHIADAYEKLPRLAEISSRIAEVSVSTARARLNGVPASEDFITVIAQLASERRQLLSSHGYPEDFLELHCDCPYCHDTGYIGNNKCSCFKKAEIELLYDQSNIRDILKEENFTNFSFDYYSTDLIHEGTKLSSLDAAKLAYQRGRNFIESFDKTFDNLFIYGDTGVGKTFLSHCIAKELIDRSYCVIYFTAFDLFDLFARHTFSTSAEARELHENIFNCDLLIIDDLGTELTNSFVSSQLFLCINERILRKKSTLISTNLSLDRFAEIYSERTFSRISSCYTMIKLFGNDIRIQKKLMGGKM